MLYWLSPFVGFLVFFSLDFKIFMPDISILFGAAFFFSLHIKHGCHPTAQMMSPSSHANLGRLPVNAMVLDAMYLYNCSFVTTSS